VIDFGTSAMKLNLGCGNKKIPDWINVDKIAACNPDQVVDLERLPWPWADDSVDMVLLNHVLEHLGAVTETYLGIIKELHRVCRPDAWISINVPHPRHQHFINDPTHVRAITPQGLRMFSQAQNRAWIARGHANTPLGIYLGVDFTIEKVSWVLDEFWRDQVKRHEISKADLSKAIRHYNNVVTEIKIVMRAVKPSGSTP
jgi:predicted SAM-dependent methyltransferase